MGIENGIFDKTILAQIFVKIHALPDLLSRFSTFLSMDMSCCFQEADVPHSILFLFCRNKIYIHRSLTSWVSCPTMAMLSTHPTSIVHLVSVEFLSCMHRCNSILGMNLGTCRPVVFMKVKLSTK